MLQAAVIESVNELIAELDARLLNHFPASISAYMLNYLTN